MNQFQEEIGVYIINRNEEIRAEACSDYVSALYEPMFEYSDRTNSECLEEMKQREVGDAMTFNEWLQTFKYQFNEVIVIKDSFGKYWYEFRELDRVDESEVYETITFN